MMNCLPRGCGLEQRLYRCWNHAGWKIIHMDNRSGFLVDPHSPVPGTIREIYPAMSGNDTPCCYMSGGT